MKISFVRWSTQILVEVSDCSPKPSHSRPAATVREKWTVTCSRAGEGQVKAARESMSQLGNTGFLLSVTDVFKSTFVPKFGSIQVFKMKKFVTTCSVHLCLFLSEWAQTLFPKGCWVLTPDSFRKNPSGCIHWPLSGRKWAHVPDFERWRCWVNYPCMTEVPAGLWRCGFESPCGSCLSVSPSWQCPLPTNVLFF